MSHRGLLVLGVVLAASSCGDGQSSSTPADVGTGGSGAGAGTGGSSGSGGSTLDGGGSAGSPVSYEATCNVGAMTLAGGLADGTRVDGLVDAHGLSANPPSWDIVRAFGRGGLLLLRLDGVTLPPFQGPTLGVDYPVLGQIQLPGNFVRPFETVCVDSGSFVRIGVDGDRFALEGVESRACPGDPVDGALEMCLSNSSAACPEPVTGTLDGVSMTGLSFYASAGDAYTHHVLFTDATRGTFVLVAHQGGVVSAGHVRTQLDGPFGGATYCIGAGSTVNTGTTTTLSLKGFSKLASCDGAVGGRVDACWVRD